MDKRKHHGAMDKCSSEQQFHKSEEITFVVKTRAFAIVETSLSSGCLADWQMKCG